MEPVKLDFRGAQSGASGPDRWLTVLAAAAVLLCAVIAGWLATSNYQLDETVRERRAELRRQQDAGLAAAAYDPDGELARRIATPWQKLLLAIESANDPRIALLEIRPDAGRRQLRLTGESANLDEALDYLRRLQALPELKRPHLVSHAIVPNPEGAMTLRFIIQADWVGL